MNFEPTEEQAHARDVFLEGDSMVIEALAGTGKTTSLELLARSAPNKRGRYLAFNRAIVRAAAAQFPENIDCSTAHSLAFRAVGKNYKHRLESARMRSIDVARQLGVEPIFVRVGDATKVLQPGYLASLTQKAALNFCRTADQEPGLQHVPYIEGIDPIEPGGKKTYDNNRIVARAVVPWLRRAWDDLSSIEGRLRFSHDCYLKIWQLSNPTIRADFLLFDEAQDADPVVLDVVLRQAFQRVLVGDANQEVYAWRGAVNAIEKIKEVGDAKIATLTKSFRFGEGIAEVANDLLEQLESELRIIGAGPPSTVDALDSPDCILSRTNAAAVATVLMLQVKGHRPHLVGGGTEVLSFARAAKDLMQGKSTFHPELACFDSWSEVQIYVNEDAMGSELRLLVKLVDEFGVDTIERALGQMPEEFAADTVVSTAHKAKGREWPSVQLAGDFPDENLDKPELRLLYVAATRAKQGLDITNTVLADEEEESETPEPVEATT